MAKQDTETQTAEGCKVIGPLVSSCRYTDAITGSGPGAGLNQLVDATSVETMFPVLKKNVSLATKIVNVTKSTTPGCTYSQDLRTSWFRSFHLYVQERSDISSLCEILKNVVPFLMKRI